MLSFRKPIVGGEGHGPGTGLLVLSPPTLGPRRSLLHLLCGLGLKCCVREAAVKTCEQMPVVAWKVRPGHSEAPHVATFICGTATASQASAVLPKQRERVQGETCDQRLAATHRQGLI